MKILDEVKGFYWLRRIAIALEKQNELVERQLKLLEDEWTAKHAPVVRKKSEFSLMDQEEINKDFERRIQAERDGIELDD
jgi:hypothetical protein